MFDINSSFSEDTVTVARNIEQLWDVMRFFDIDKEKKISLDQLWEQDEAIRFFHSAVDPTYSYPDGLISFKAIAGIHAQQVAVVVGDCLIIDNYAIVVIVAFTGQCDAVAPDAEPPSEGGMLPMQHYQMRDIKKELCWKEKFFWQEGTTIQLPKMVEDVCQTLRQRIPIVMAPQLDNNKKSKDDSHLV